jgi:uncharacterized protein
MPTCFLDTNILLRFLTRDDERKAQRALNLLMRIEQGEEKVITSSLVISEAVYTLQRLYKVPRPIIKQQLLDIISMRNLSLPDKSLYYQAFNFYVTKNISFADAFNAAYMLAQKIPSVYSWDEDFDKIEGIVRFEPEAE